MSEFFISVCIPSYNRPAELRRLLESIDYSGEDLQIVICEDKSPKRVEIRETVNDFAGKSKYKVKYKENPENYGYDKNIRSFIDEADGEYIIYMGDDDVFIPTELDKYIAFIKEHKQIGYILRSYVNVYKDGSEEVFRYFPSKKYFKPSEDAYVTLFRKSVFISGFTFRREFAKDSKTDCFDGTLLYQLYIQAEISLNHNSAYYDVPFTKAYEGGEFFFGNSEAEKGKYVPNKHTVEGELTFIRSFFLITKYIDKKYNLHSTEKVKRDMSRYSYPIMATVAPNGRSDLSKFYKGLKKIGLDSTPYFNLYYVGLMILGKNTCDSLIKLIKKTLGHTPKL